MKRRVIAICLAVMLMAMLLPVPASAVSASAWMSGPDTVRAGDTITVSFSVSGTGLYGVSGVLAYDSSSLTLTGKSQSVGGGWALEFNGNNFTAYDNNLAAPINGGTTIFRATFQVNNVPEGTGISVSCQSVRASDGTADAYIGTVSYSATIAPPLSSDNLLKTMSVSNATISPAFSPNVTNYTAQVPYETAKLNVTATANDEKATVTINSPTLTPNGTTNVTVTVAAENGDTKIYTISVKRAQDPNYVPSNNSKLTEITVDGFLLSPGFSSDRTTYVIWLPYEVDSVTIGGTAEDRLATVKVEGGSNLIAGEDNPVKVICTAEDGTKTVYTVFAKRGPAHEGMELPTEPPTEATEPEETTQITETVSRPTPEPEKKGMAEGSSVLLIGLALVLGMAIGLLLGRVTKKKKQ